jgi:hypothetical protein
LASATISSAVHARARFLGTFSFRTSLGSPGTPLVIVASCRIVAPLVSNGRLTYRVTGASRSIFPWEARSRTSAATNVLVVLAIANAEVGLMGVPVASTPAAPAHDPSGETTAAESPITSWPDTHTSSIACKVETIASGRAALFGSSHADGDDGDAAGVAVGVAVAAGGDGLLAGAAGLAAPAGDPPEQPPSAVPATSSRTGKIPARCDGPLMVLTPLR